MDLAAEACDGIEQKDDVLPTFRSCWVSSAILPLLGMARRRVSLWLAACFVCAAAASVDWTQSCTEAPVLSLLHWSATYRCQHFSVID